MSVWNQPRKRPPVIVQASLLAGTDDFDFVVQVADFADQMQMSGRYRPDELPAHAVQLSEAYIYDCEIRNGGHGQYIYNRMVDAGREEARERFVFAHDGLIAMGAVSQANILLRMILWFDASPQTANGDMEFGGGRDKELEDLDSEFYEANYRGQYVSGAIVKSAAVWIRGWSDLKPVEDSEFGRAYSELVLGNPQRLPRIAAVRIEKFAAALKPFPAGVGLAVAAAKEILVRMIDVHEANIGDERKMAWRLLTNTDVRYAAADENGVSLYEYVPLDGPQTSLGVHARSGALLGRATAEDIDGLMSRVDEWLVASAADFLLRLARPDAKDAVLSPAGLKRPASWLKRLLRSQTDDAQHFYIALNEDVFVLSQSNKGFVLSADNGAEMYGPVTVHEAEKHRQDMTANC